MAPHPDPASSTGVQQHGPRVLYIDADDDLPALLDRVEETGSPAIVVLPDGARAVRGTVSARLLRRRAEAAGIAVVAVTTDRTTIAQLQGVGIESAPTVGDARSLLPGRHLQLPLPSAATPPAATVPPEPADDQHLSAIAWDEDEEDEGLDEDQSTAALPTTADTRVAPTWPSTTSRGRDASDPDDPTLIVSPMAATHDTIVQVAQARQDRGTGGAFRIWAILLATLAVLALLGAAVWVVFFPAATLTITYAIGTFDRTYQTRVGTGAETIPIYTTHLSRSDSRTVAATGTTLVPDGHAAGTLALANPNDGSVVVPAGTIVATDAGIRFATTVDTRIPGAAHTFNGTTNGQGTIEVRAMDAGTAGNVPVGAIDQLMGRLRGVLLITNYAATAGGTVKTVYSFTAADLTTPAQALKTSLSRQVQSELYRRYARSPIRTITALHAGTPTIQHFSRDGRPYATVGMTVQADLEYVHQQDITRYLQTHLAVDLQSRDQALVPSSEHTSISYTRNLAQTNISIHVRARAVPVIDIADLRAHLVGQSVSDARQYLQGAAHYGGWTFTLDTNPNLAGRMPQAAGLIDIESRQQGG